MSRRLIAFFSVLSTFLAFLSYHTAVAESLPVTPTRLPSPTPVITVEVPTPTMPSPTPMSTIGTPSPTPLPTVVGDSNPVEDTGSGASSCSGCCVCVTGSGDSVLEHPTEYSVSGPARVDWSEGGVPAEVVPFWFPKFLLGQDLNLVKNEEQALYLVGVVVVLAAGLGMVFHAVALYVMSYPVLGNNALVFCLYMLLIVAAVRLIVFLMRSLL